MLDFEGWQRRLLAIHSRSHQFHNQKLDNPRTVLGNRFLKKKANLRLARKMMFFPLIILEAQKHDSPHIIATYMEELAQLFNHFYNEVSIIGTEDAKLRASRIAPIKSVATVIKTACLCLELKLRKKYRQNYILLYTSTRQVFIFGHLKKGRGWEKNTEKILIH